MSIYNVLQLMGMLLAPLVALQVSRYLERRREKRDRQMKVFRTLMATRSRKLGQAHVEALNMIDIEFADRSPRERQVAHAWKMYLDQLNRPFSGESWLAKTDELFVDLLFNMAVCLGYDFDKVHIRNQSYAPRAHGDEENDQRALRKAALALLQGQTALPVQAVANSANAPLELPDGRAGLQPVAPTQTP
jgi:hypothetical protein